MANLSVTEQCPRCDGEKIIATGPCVEGLTMTKTCPRCSGKGTITVERAEHTHFDPQELRK